MAETSTCLSPACGVTVEGSFTKCPECGWAMRGPRNIRIRGWVLVGLGLFLAVFMGAITWYVAPMMLHPGKEFDGTTFEGKPSDVEFAFTIFGLVILFGLLSIANGAWMIIKGRQNRLFQIVSLGIAAILFAIGWAIRRKLM